MVAKTKKCKGCKKHKHTSQFTAAVTTTDKKMVYCKACIKVYNKEYYQTHKIRLLQKSNDRSRNRKRKRQK